MSRPFGVLIGLALFLFSEAAAAERGLARLAGPVNAPGARDAIARVAYAEAAGQGDAGLAGVVFTILNRLAAGSWGSSVDAVVNARAQFEPVLRAGGDWRALPIASPAQRARIDTIVNLALEGRLPDPTGGALYFQNPAVVAARAKAGAVSRNLVHFGGATPSAVIGDHSFYVATGKGAGRRSSPVEPVIGDGDRGLFVLADGAIVEDWAAVRGP